MQAAVYYGPRDIRVEEVPLPDLAEDELLVRIRACGICGSDLHMYRLGMFEALGRRVESGRIMGHELSGEAVAVGPKVTGFRVGDRIAGVGVGGFAEYTPLQITERSPHPLPEHISFEEGATLEPLATSLHGVGLAKPTAGETVVILGAGIIGLGCLQAIRATVSCRVIVVDASAQTSGHGLTAWGRCDGESDADRSAGGSDRFDRWAQVDRSVRGQGRLCGCGDRLRRRQAFPKSRTVYAETGGRTFGPGGAVRAAAGVRL
jgi:threonine dehydrogenase-like Zn-dependent dehydrogenase